MKRRDLISVAGGVAAPGSVASVFAQNPAKMEHMHAPKYKAVEESSSECVASGEDCLRHSMGMWAMKDTTMAACTNAVMQLVAVCRALHTLAALNSPFTPDFAKNTAAVCDAAAKECQPFYTKYPECKVCADSCRKCAEDCRKLTGAGRS